MFPAAWDSYVVQVLLLFAEFTCHPFPKLICKMMSTIGFSVYSFKGPFKDLKVVHMVLVHVLKFYRHKYSRDVPSSD